ncbi:MAG: OFA family MFS transporter [Oscillospiraceae bacterium]|nr:OFA family MFS transporter [Oscillospiraceae bacterium]
MEKSITRKGVFAVIAAISIQLIVGIAYIWSVFQDDVTRTLFGGNNYQAALTFSILLSIIAIGSVIGGKLAVKFSTRIVVFAGGIILSAGFFLAAFTTARHPWVLWLTYGLMGGVGMGFTYSTTIACVQKWYPHKKGLVTGIILSALGIGSVVFAPFIEWLVSVFHHRAIMNLGFVSWPFDPANSFEYTGIPETFMVLAGIFLVICTLGSIFLKNPPDGYMADVAVAARRFKPKRDDLTPRQMLKTPQFYLVTFSFLLACVGGMMIIAFAMPIAVARGGRLAETAVIGVMAIGFFNSFGRLLWGKVSDKIGRKNTIMILLAASAVLFPFVIAMSGTVLLYAYLAVIGLMYGGLLATFPAITADLFGAKHMATNYGFVLLGFGAASVIATQIAGHFRNVSAYYGEIERMWPAFLIAALCSAGGIVLMLILRAINKKRDAKEAANG